MKIIGFAGRKRSGKTTLSKYLEKNYGAKIITIADALKNLLCKILNVSYDELNTMKDDGKQHPYTVDKHCIDILSKELQVNSDVIAKILPVGTKIYDIRQMLQIIGTDLIRNLNPTWHIDKMVDAINACEENDIVVIDDVRFPNEKEKIIELGGEVFFIIRPYYKEWSTHISETALSWRDFNVMEIIINVSETADDFIAEYQTVLNSIVNDEPYKCDVTEHLLINYNTDVRHNFEMTTKAFTNYLLMEDIKSLSLNTSYKD